MKKNKFMVETVSAVKVKTPPPLPTREVFLQVFMKNLILAKKKHPDLYAFPGSDVVQVFRSFTENFKLGTYSRQCHAIKWTCKELKIENNRETIDLIFTESETDGDERPDDTALSDHAAESETEN